MSRSRIVQGARSGDDIPGRCDVTKICDWRIWQPICQTSSDLLVLDTRDVVQKYVVDNVYRIESLGCQQYDNLYGNGYSYGAPFSHVFTELKISPIEVHISAIQLQISSNRLNCRYLQMNCRYLQMNCRYLQMNCRYLQFN